MDEITDATSRDTQCPKCDSSDIQFDENFGHYTCNHCGNNWAYDGDDPDYSDADDESEAFAHYMEDVEDEA